MGTLQAEHLQEQRPGGGAGRGQKMASLTGSERTPERTSVGSEQRKVGGGGPVLLLGPHSLLWVFRERSVGRALGQPRLTGILADDRRWRAAMLEDPWVLPLA